MSKTIKLLLVEDSADDARLVIRMLKRGGFDAQHERVASAAAMAAALQRQAWDAVVSDYNMPGFSGLDALSILRAAGLDIPFILISGTVGEEIAVEAMKAGANDYIVKSNLSRLAAVLKRELREAANRARQRRAEIELRTLSLAVRQSGTGIVITDAAGAIEFVNPKFETMSGYSAAEVRGKNPRLLKSGMTPPETYRILWQAITAGKEWSGEIQNRKKTGELYWEQQRISPVLDDNGRTLHFIAVKDDITERRRAGNELQRFRMAMDVSVDSIYLTDPASMRFVYLNETACRRLGYSRERLLQMGPQDVLSMGREEIGREYDAVIAAGDRGLSHERRFVRSDGSKGWTELHRRALRTEGGTLIVTIGRDITERREAGNALRRTSAQLRMLVDSSPLAIYTRDPDGRLTSWNAAAEQMYGWTASEVLGKPLPSVPDEERAESDGLRRRLLAGERFIKHEAQRRRRDGSLIQIEAFLGPLHDDAGSSSGIIAVVADVTKRKQAEDGVRRLNRIYAVLSGINAAIVRINDRDELFRETCRIAVEHGGFGIAQILLVDEDGYEVWPGPHAGMDALPVVRASFRPGAETISRQGTTIRAIRERKPVFTNDITREPPVGALRTEALRRGYGSVISLPLTVRDRIVAVLLLCAKEKNFFDEQERRLLGELAGDVSFALDHLEKAERLKIEAAERLRAETSVRRLNRVHAVLSGINALIVRVRDRDELFKQACRIAVEEGSFRLAWLGVVDRNTMRVKPVAWSGAGEDFIELMRLDIGVAAPEGHGIAARAVLEKKPIISADMTQDPRAALRNQATTLGFHSLAVLPLLVGGDAIGVLALYAGEVAFFDDEEMKLLTELAGDIAFALDHIDKANKLDYLAFYDALTGLANRTLFHERLGQYAHAAQQGRKKLALVLADVERFKTINDSLGRQTGDELLKQLAGRLGRAVEPAAIARIGSDHFAIMLPEIKGRSEIGRTVDRIWRDCFAQPFRVNDTELRVSAKAGIALFPSDGGNADELFANAEAALQQAQETGERYQFHTRELTAGVAEELALENKLRSAFENSEFVLHYQPKVDVVTRAIVGVEALIRWQNPELGLVPPGKFIPLMEETGLILEVGTWALRQASLDHRKWVDQGLKAPRVAVNVSSIQLRRRDFVATVEQAIMEGVAPTGIDLEITESLIMEDVQGSIEKLKAVRALGVRIAIDDFGTGYSSLGYLAKLPVQTLKIDRSFIITMLGDADTMTLVQTIISLAHSLRLKVVAEGVDMEEQAKVLRLLRCDQMQGYLFSKPLPFEAMTVLLKPPLLDAIPAEVL